MNQKRGLSFIALFIIALVVSLPFYVADVYAVSVSITKNQGSAGLEGFINAQGDSWTVEATIAGYNETVSADKVKLKVGENEAEFNSCSDSALGTTCEYVSPLNDGVTEGGYDFSVLFNFLDPLGVETSVGDSDTIVADGSAPEITFNSITQEGGEVKLDFSVKDEPGLCVGLEKIEISEVGGEVLQTIDNFVEKDCDYSFAEDGGVLQASLAGEGRKSLKIKAIDRLGHESSVVKSFEADFVAPVINEGISFVDFGDFIGQYEAETSIQVNVTEHGNYLKARAYSEQAKLSGEEVACQPAEEEDLWTCTWENIEVIPSSSISVKIEAEDGAGNTAEKTISKSFVVDDKAPEVVSFGTERTFDDTSYVKEGNNRIILKVKEAGAGISSAGIRANLGELGGSTFEAPDYFNETTYQAYWDVSKNNFATDNVPLSLSYFQDKVGNEGSRPEIEAQVDTDGPDIEKAEVYGMSEAGQKDYFQSNDVLRLEMTIAENSGLLILVDLNDLVMDAETKFPPFSFGDLGDYTGYQMFTEQDCEREEGKWVCSLEINEPLKSGPDSSANLNIEVYDTAGNKATWSKDPGNVKSGSEGNYKLELLGLDLEEEPDFWEVSSVKPLGGGEDFIDMDTTELISTRMAMKINLKTDSNAKAAKIDLVGCEPEEGFGAEQREVLFDNLVSGAMSSPKPILTLEFSPFNSQDYFNVGKEDTFRQAYLNYTCHLNIYSQVGRKALRYAESQEVGIKVPFAFTSLGSKDENLKKKIADAKSGYYEDTAWLETVSKVLDWLDYIANIINVITTVNEIVDIFGSEPLKSAGGKVEKMPFLQALGTALKGGCYGLQMGQKHSWDFVKYLQIPTGILSCQPTSGEQWAAVGDSWYMYWQRTVLKGYNAATGRASLGIPATSLYDNFYVASIGLCVPGVIYNLKQLREIHCRKIVCLQQEVPQGIATVEACDKLFELQNCEFFAGPGIALIPGFGAVSMIGDALKSIFVSPLGLISLGELAACGSLCFIEEPEGALTTCKVAKFIDKALTLVNSIVGFVKQRPDLTSSPYCSMVKDDLEEKPEEQAPVEEAGVEET